MKRYSSKELTRITNQAGGSRIYNPWFQLIFFLFYLAVVRGAELQATPVDAAEQSVVRVQNLSQRGDGLYFQGTGSGVVIDRFGFILTNDHVLEGHDQIYVQWKTSSGAVRDEPARVIRRDSTKDLALLKVNGLDVDPVPFAAELPRKGTQIYAIGFPSAADLDVRVTIEDINRGFVEATVTQGVVSRVLSRKITASKMWEMIQHDAVISGGSSGGALINSCGELVGINTSGAVIETDRGDKVAASGFGFAIQAPVAFSFAQENGAKPSTRADICDPQARPSASTQNISPLSSANPSLISLIVLGVIVVGVVAGGIAFIERRRLRSDEKSASSPRSFRKSKWTITGTTTSGEKVGGVIYEGRATPSLPVILGRDASCSIVVPDPTVSRNHVKFFVDDGRLWCVDLQSSNGTQIDNSPVGVTPTFIPRGSTIKVGKVVLSIHSASDRELS